VTKWHDWDGTIRCNPSSIEYPTTEQEVVSIVQRALEQGTTLRVFGAGHSWSPLVKSDGILINLDRLVVPPSIVGNLVTVSAGMRLRDLGPWLQQKGLALKNLGAITAQSIAGAVGTGTHGTGREFEVIGSQITSMRIVDGKGVARDVGSATEMAAFRLSLGCLGVVVSVTIECVKDHSVELLQIPMEFDEFLKKFEHLYVENERVRAYWFPGSKRVFVNTMNTVQTPSKPGSIYPWFEAVVKRQVLMGAFWRLGSACEPLIPMLNGLQETIGYKRGKRLGRVFDAITTPMPPFHQEAEVAIPIEDGPAAVQAYGRLVRQKGYKVNVPSEIRFAHSDDILLSPGNGMKACYIGGYTATYRRNDPFFTDFYDMLKGDFRGRPHWGKIDAPDRKTAMAIYPGFTSFEKIRNQCDPQGVFANSYIKELFAL